MGNSAKKEIHFLVQGLNGAGKTSIINQLKKEGIEGTVEEIGNMGVSFKQKKTKYILLEINDNIKEALIKQLYGKIIDGLIFVVDASDKGSIDESSKAFQKMIAEEDWKDCPILVYANKLDKNDCFTPKEVIEKLGTDQLKDKTFTFQGANCTTEEGVGGVKSGFEWIISMIAKK